MKDIPVLRNYQRFSRNAFVGLWPRVREWDEVFEKNSKVMVPAGEPCRVLGKVERPALITGLKR
jgi:hypothetical protein